MKSITVQTANTIREHLKKIAPINGVEKFKVICTPYKNSQDMIQVRPSNYIAHDESGLLADKLKAIFADLKNSVRSEVTIYFC